MENADFGTASAANNAEERKRQRRKRIEKNNVSEVTANEDATERNIFQQKTGQQQVDESLLTLDIRKHAGLKQVTDVHIETNDAEARRRVEDEDVRKSRLSKLQQEALTSAKANAAIEMKWTELLEKDIPQELFQEIQLQMQACSAIIASKDDLIKDFTKQLHAKDEEYVRALRQHSEDIDTLLSRIRSEFRELQVAYDQELDHIEESYLKEGDGIVAEHTSEIDAMFEQRRLKENGYKENKTRTEEDCKRDLEAAMKRGADQYNKTKIDTEMNIQALKQQLEEIRATYQLNTEKLDYNFRVLVELEVEKSAEVGLYKRKLNKLKTQYNALVTRFTEMEATDLRTNSDLTEDYRTLTLKYKDLQAKFRHFEVADTTKYDEVWALHEEEVKDLVDQLLKADKILTEQMLGWAWRAPDMAALQAVLGRHGGGVGGIAATPAAGPGGEEADGEGVTTTDNNAGNVPAELSLEAAALMMAATGAEEDQGPSPEEVRQRVAGVKVRAVLRVLATEAGFMINSAVREALSSLPEEEADVARAELLLKALGVKSEEKLQQLVGYFFREKSDEVLNMEASLDEEGDYEAELALLLRSGGAEDLAALRDMIKPEDVIEAVRSYIEEVAVEQGPLGGAAAVAGGTKVTAEEVRIAQKRLASMRNYWSQLSQIVSDETVDVWRQLEFDSQNLRDLLTKRSQNISKVDRLAKRNAELKQLLNQYLGDAVTNTVSTIQFVFILLEFNFIVPR